jgi:hypothetical protein
MSPNIPIPTDSVHKFYAGFGLVVFIASLIASVFVQNSFNEKVIMWFEEAGKIEKIINKTDVDETQLKRIKELIDVLKQDQSTFMNALFSFAVIGLFISGWGFQYWEKRIQPKLDEKLDLEVELLKLEVESKKRTNKRGVLVRFPKR